MLRLLIITGAKRAGAEQANVNFSFGARDR